MATWVYLLKKAPTGVVARVAPIRALHTLLVNKYYLDRLFVDGVVGSVKGPIARATYWTNQYIIDGLVRSIGGAAKKIGGFVYNILDQRGVDGVVNGLGAGASQTGGVLRMAQSGRIQQYALMLFGAVGLLGLAIAVVN
jgi:NADH-quinone oxidoreductase subunit L